VTPRFLFALLLILAAPVRATATAAEGQAAYDRKDWPACARLFAAAAPSAEGLRRALIFQSAACCAALGGDRDEAFRLLDLAARHGLREVPQVTKDADLDSLHGDPRWAGAVAAVKRNEDAFLASIGNPALRTEILAMAQEDQAVRRPFLQGGRPTDEDREKAIAADARHRARMKEILAANGWPGKKLVGEDGAKAAWLLVQHADRDRAFQKQCLALLEKAVKAGDANGKELAYLTDRVAVAEGRKQTYGTQFSGSDPDPIEDEEHVDERRKAVGLPTLEEYRRQVQEMYGPR
jgi:hypothetical protein